MDVHGADARDWEDLARGPGGELWIADIGDNRRRRDAVQVYRLEEPLLTAGGAPHALSVRATRHDLIYPDGPHDAEALLAEPATGRAFVVTKEVAVDAGIYATEAPLAAGTSHRLVRVGSLALPLVTGGAVSPDGRRAVLRTYLDAGEFAIDGDLAAALTGPARRVALPREPQGEAVSYTADGNALLTVSEGKGEAISRTPLDQPAPAPETPPEVQPTPERRPGPPPPAALAALGALLLGAVVLLRRRR